MIFKIAIERENESMKRMLRKNMKEAMLSHLTVVFLQALKNGYDANLAVHDELESLSTEFEYIVVEAMKEIING